MRKLLAASIVGGLALSQAAASAYEPGYYSGRTSQRAPITFVAAGGQVSELRTQITDGCNPGNWYVTLYPHPARIDSRGSWSHRAPGAFPTIYHGHLSGNRASGTIDDRNQNAVGRACHGHVSFHAKRSNPMRVDSATVSPGITNVAMRLSMPTGSKANQIVPYTALALLIYGSNSGCRARYETAAAQADRSKSRILDAYVTDAYIAASSRAHSHGVFSFTVSTGTIVSTASGASPFSTVCAMLYSGKPSAAKPGGNIAVATVHAALVVQA